MIMSLSKVIIAPVVTLITNCQEIEILEAFSQKDKLKWTLSIDFAKLHHQMGLYFQI